MGGDRIYVGRLREIKNIIGIFICAFCVYIFIKSIVEKPLLLTELSGKLITCVGAFKSSSIAGD